MILFEKIKLNTKRIIAFLLCIIVCTSFALPFELTTSNAAFNKSTANSIANNADISRLSAKAYSCAHLDKEGGIVIDSENATVHYTVGNLVKLMTIYICFEQISQGKTTLDSAITVSSAAQKCSVGHERVFLDAGKGEVITVSEALTAICVAGANDACYALAEKLSGSTEEKFVELMNAKANELGMENTNYVDSTGLKTIDEGQYSCAHDICLLSYYLVKNYPEALEFTSQDSQYFHHTSTNQPDTMMNSSNLLMSLGMLEGCDGLLVGYSNADKYAQAATYQVDGERVFAVVIGEETAEARAGELKYLLQYTINNFALKSLYEAGTYVRMISIKDGKSLKLKTVVGETFTYLSDLRQDVRIDNQIVLNDEIKAPVAKDDIVGEVVYTMIITEDDEETRVTLGSVDLLAAEDIDRAGWFTRFIRKILKFFGIGDY